MSHTEKAPRADDSQGPHTNSLDASADLGDLTQVRKRLDTLTCIAYGVEISRKIADDETADPAERERARESADVMLREIARGVAELHARFSEVSNG
jgi:hypothetical protein